jgi:hypothetical protein
MLLDRALRATFRNFSTVFLLLAIVTLPLHLAHAVAFHSVIALRELHPTIEEFPRAKQIRGVGREDIAAARRAALAVTALELALAPLLVGAARRALAADERGQVPTVTSAWRGVGRAPGSAGALARRAPTSAAVVGLGLAAWGLARAAGAIVIEPLPEGLAFAGVGLVDGLARALGGSLALGGLAAVALEGAAAEAT